MTYITKILYSLPQRQILRPDLLCRIYDHIVIVRGRSNLGVTLAHPRYDSIDQFVDGRVLRPSRFDRGLLVWGWRLERDLLDPLRRGRRIRVVWYPLSLPVARGRHTRRRHSWGPLGRAAHRSVVLLLPISLLPVLMIARVCIHRGLVGTRRGE